jgi:hypothetical protein
MAWEQSISVTVLSAFGSRRDFLNTTVFGLRLKWREGAVGGKNLFHLTSACGIRRIAVT